MVERDHRYARLGMMFGIFVGGGAATLLFAATGNALSFIAAGLGAAVGLLIGAGVDSGRSGAVI